MSDTELPLLWFLARASGLVSMVALTVAVILGIAAGARSSVLPRFLIQGVHKVAALTGVLLLAVHICVVVVDPFVDVSWADVWWPFGADYQRVAVGLGAVAIDILLVVLVTSMVRRRMSPRGWWLIHLTAYLAYGLTIAHAIVAGTDTKQPLVFALTTGCVGAVLGAVTFRLWRAGNGRGTRHDAGIGPREGVQI